MGSIKQKKEINTPPDADIFVVPLMKPRSQEMADRRRRQSNPIPEDLKYLAHRMSNVNEVEHQPSGDVPTTTSEELKKENSSYYNRQTGRSIRWH